MRTKYGAVPLVVDGIRFHSTVEARRYSELKLLVKAKQIESLELQPKFALRTLLTTGGIHGAARALAGDYPIIGHYVADFRYFRFVPTGWVVEDVKGCDTPLSKWKRKHTEAQYGVTINLIRSRR